MEGVKAIREGRDVFVINLRHSMLVQVLGIDWISIDDKNRNIF